MTKYRQVHDGDWEQPKLKKFFKISCCDCGLVHRWQLRTRKGRIEFRAFRDKRATAAKRRYMKAS